MDRRLLLKSGLALLLALTGSNSFAEIVDAASHDHAKAIGPDGLLRSQLRLGDDLVRYLAGHPKRNAAANAIVVVSPASLAVILSFVDLGASPALRSAIHQVLGFRSSGQGGLDGDLTALSDGVAAIIGQSGPNGPLVLANLLAFDRTTKPRQLALDGLSKAGADVLVDDLSNVKTVERINAWVKRKTEDLIPSILGEAPESLGLVAVNALYFKDKWQTPFDVARTAPAKFQLGLGKTADVDMMHSPPAHFRFRQDDRFIAAELDYATSGFTLVVVTTKSKPALQSDFAAVSGWLSGVGFAADAGEVALPKLSLEAAEELLAPLDALGLRTARLSRDALNGFSPERLTISRVVQKLDLRLDEGGTEAAAATAVVTTRSLPMPAPIKMTVDKPFIFALRDQKAGLILFMGYVGTPRA